MSSSELSVYILTLNSERLLGQVLGAAAQVADEIIIVDSGSTDKTAEIVRNYPAQFLYRKFDNFRDQRVFSEDACTKEWILALDSDEVLSTELIKKINELKNKNFNKNEASPPDGFSIRRNWFFMGNPVHTFYPVKTPEFIVRLFKKNKISTRGSRIIHESLQLHNCLIKTIEEPINHYCCASIDDLYKKIGLYTTLSAEDMRSNGVQSSWIKIYIYPWLIWAQWYFINGAWKDGELGVILCKYVRTTVYLKYLKLKHLPLSPSQK